MDTLRARMEPAHRRGAELCRDPPAPRGVRQPRTGPHRGVWGRVQPSSPCGGKSKRMCPSKCMVPWRRPSQTSHRLRGLLWFSCWHSAWWHTCGAQPWAGEGGRAAGPPPQAELCCAQSLSWLKGSIKAGDGEGRESRGQPRGCWCCLAARSPQPSSAAPCGDPREPRGCGREAARCVATEAGRGPGDSHLCLVSPSLPRATARCRCPWLG